MGEVAKLLVEINKLKKENQELLQSINEIKSTVKQYYEKVDSIEGGGINATDNSPNPHTNANGDSPTSTIATTIKVEEVKVQHRLRSSSSSERKPFIKTKRLSRSSESLQIKFLTPSHTIHSKNNEANEKKNFEESHDFSQFILATSPTKKSALVTAPKSYKMVRSHLSIRYAKHTISN